MSQMSTGKGGKGKAPRADSERTYTSKAVRAGLQVRRHSGVASGPTLQPLALSLTRPSYALLLLVSGLPCPPPPEEGQLRVENRPGRARLPCGRA